MSEKYGKLTVVKTYMSPSPSGTARKRAVCNCDCGGAHDVCYYNLKRGNSRGCPSCSSAAKGKSKEHIHYSSEDTKRDKPELYKAYGIWRGMISRCTNPNHKSYSDYGGRGISVCDRWVNSVDNFISDMGFRPSDKHQIDREDNDKGYSLENCRWVTATENARNKRDTVMLTINGTKKPMTEWAEQTSTAIKTIEARVKRGWSHERAVFGTRHGKRYTTPEGEFKTLLEVQEVYNMSSSGVHSRFKSNKFPDWTIKEGN